MAHRTQHISRAVDRTRQRHRLETVLEHVHWDAVGVANQVREDLLAICFCILGLPAEHEGAETGSREETEDRGSATYQAELRSDLHKTVDTLRVCEREHASEVAPHRRTDDVNLFRAQRVDEA